MYPAISIKVDLERACTDLIISKTFDNGMICASEQAVIVDKDIAAEFEEIMKKYGCYFERTGDRAGHKLCNKP